MPIPIKVISYDQTAAPQVTGEIGKLDAVLYAALVTGFNSKNVSSISVTDNVATVTTSTDHGYMIGDGIKIEGANESIFNDEFEIITVPTTTTFTFPLVTGIASATGTITAKIAPLGWERVYTGTNKSVYRSLDPAATRLYLRIDDSAARTAVVSMYETMDSIDTGTGKSPDVFWSKSTVASTAVHQWFIAGNKKTFYPMIETNLVTPTTLGIYYFGDYKSFRTNDPWSCGIGGQSVVDTAFPLQNTGMVYSTGATTGMYLARGLSWIGPAVSFGFYGVSRTNYGMTATPDSKFPSLSDNSLHLTPIYIYDTAWRGLASGLFFPLETCPLGLAYPNKTKFIQDGKNYVLFRFGSSSASNWGNFAFSLSEGDWA